MNMRMGIFSPPLYQKTNTKFIQNKFVVAMGRFHSINININKKGPRSDNFLESFTTY